MIAANTATTKCCEDFSTSGEGFLTDLVRFFKLSEREIAQQAPNCSGKSSRDEQIVVVLPKPAKDVCSETARADSGGNGCNADRNHDRNSNTGKYYGHGERQFDHLQTCQPVIPIASAASIVLGRCPRFR